MPAPRRRSAAPVVLIVVIVVFVLLAAGGIGIGILVSGGRYAVTPYACGLVPPSQLNQLIPHGLSDSSYAKSESSCSWSNLSSVNAGLEKSVSHLTVRVSRYGRGLLTSAEKKARQNMSDRSVVRTITPMSGYGQDTLRLVKAYGGTYDGIQFRVSNLVVEVAAEQDDPAGQHDDPGRSWATTQRAARIIADRLDPA